MTATLPPEVQRVFERFITTEYTTIDAARPADHLAGDALLPRRRRSDRRHDRARLSEEGRRRARATRRCRCCSPTRPGAASRAARGAGAGHGGGRRPRPGREPRALRARERSRSCPRRKSMLPAEGDPRHVRLVLHAHLRVRAPGARLRLARAAISRRAAAVRRRTWRRSAPATPRSPSVEPPAPEGGGDRLGRAHGRARAAATRPRCSRSSARTASRSRRALPVEPDRGAGRIRLGELPDWRAARPRKGLPRPRTTHGPDFRWQRNFQVRGDLDRATTTGGRSSRTA